MEKQSGFFKVSHALFENEKYKKMSLFAKILYSLMTERANLSQQNGWYDDEKRLYIYFSLKEAMEVLGVGKDKCIKVFKELDKKSGCGLIEKKAQGLGKPMIIYILPPDENEVKASEKQTSKSTKSRTQACVKTEPNNININKTDINKTYFNQSSQKEDAMEKRNKCILKIKNNIDYHVLLEKYDEAKLSMITGIMTDCILNTSEFISIGNIKYPHAVVKNRLLMLDSSHIEYVLDCLLENKKDIKNIKSYVLSALYNSYDTIDLYYEMKVKRDLACIISP